MMDRIFGLLLLFLAIFVIYGSLAMEIPFSYDPLGPRSFPLALGILLSGLSIFIIIKPDVGYELPSLDIAIKTMLLVALLFLYQMSFDVLGFLLATFLLCYFIARIFKASNKQAILSGAGISGLVFLLFSTLLEVPLPRGNIFSFVG